MTAPFANPTAAVIAEGLLALGAGDAPDPRPHEDGPSHAIIEIAAVYLESLGERIGRMPDKHLAALLDMVGVSLLPAQPASATVVFTALPGAPATSVPSGTRLGALVTGLDTPLPFETGAAVAVTGSPLAEVWTVAPGSDTAANHGPDLAAGRGATLFAGGRRVERQLLLGDPVRLALSGRAEILLDVRLRTPGALSLALAWDWWDGTTWQPFAPFVDPSSAGGDDSWDGTAGLTRSGRIRLVAPCAQGEAAHRRRDPVLLGSGPARRSRCRRAPTSRLPRSPRLVSAPSSRAPPSRSPWSSSAPAASGSPASRPTASPWRECRSRRATSRSRPAIA